MKTFAGVRIVALAVLIHSMTASGGFSRDSTIDSGSSPTSQPPSSSEVASPSAVRDATSATQPVPLGPGNHRRVLTVNARQRSYLVHVPPGYDAAKPTPVVLAFHGAFMNAGMMVGFCGLNEKSDEAGFVVVYPNGSGVGITLFWNASAESLPAVSGVANNASEKGGGGPPDDVAFTAALLNDLATVVTVDPKRVYAAGMSNGGMMCHRLAAELSDRIAAIAPVTGTLAMPAIRPARAVPIIHFHGTADTIVPFKGPRRQTPLTMQFLSVPATIDAWVKANDCPGEPEITKYPDAAPNDGTTVTRKTYGPGRAGAEVVLIEVKNGGHTWPGQEPPMEFLGKSTTDVSANDLLWEFFQRHPMP